MIEDIVIESASADDFPAPYFTNAVTSIAFGVGASAALLTQALADSGSASNAVLDQASMIVSESGSAASSFVANWSGRSSISESATASDRAVSSFENALTDSGDGTSASLSTLRQAISETSEATISVVNQNLTRVSVSETAVGSDFPSGWFQMSVLDQAQGSDSISPFLLVMQVVAESSAGSDAVTQQASFYNLLVDLGTGADAVLQTAVMLNQMAEFATGEDSASQSRTSPEPSAAPEVAGAWVAGINQMPMSRWTRLPGASGAYVNGELFVGGEGLWKEVEGDVQYSIDLGSSDFRNPMRKHLAYSYAVGEINSQMNLVVADHDEGQSDEWTYSFAVEDGEEHETIRVNLGRGHRSRYFNFRLEGEGRLQLSNVGIMYEQMSRRI